MVFIINVRSSITSGTVERRAADRRLRYKRLKRLVRAQARLNLYHARRPSMIRWIFPEAVSELEDGGPEALFCQYDFRLYSISRRSAWQAAVMTRLRCPRSAEQLLMQSSSAFWTWNDLRAILETKSGGGSAVEDPDEPTTFPSCHALFTN
jgi:hypothetical protein